MIYERREYTLRPGKADAFWQAQTQSNTPEMLGAILDHCLSYFETMPGDPARVVHLYRYASVDEWREIYSAYYQRQDPSYFAMVRPWLLRQETSFFVDPPLAELMPRWSRMQAGEEDGGSSGCVVTETILDFFPGGLVHYWPAFGQADLSGDSELLRYLVGVKVALIGRLHRVIHYHRFTSASQARSHFDSLERNAGYCAFRDVYSPWVAQSRTTFLASARVEWMRPAFSAGIQEEVINAVA